MRKLLIIGVIAMVALVLVGGRPPGGKQTVKDFEEVIFVDYGDSYHGGPPPHTFHGCRYGLSSHHGRHKLVRKSHSQIRCFDNGLFG